MNYREILVSWSPWHLRKRIAMLEESLEKLTDTRDDLLAECNRTVVKENERLKKEAMFLKSQNSMLRRGLERVRDIAYCFSIDQIMKGDTHEQK